MITCRLLALWGYSLFPVGFEASFVAAIVNDENK